MNVSRFFVVFFSALFSSIIINIASAAVTTYLPSSIHEFDRPIIHRPLRGAKILVDTQGVTPLSVLASLNGQPQADNVIEKETENSFSENLNILSEKFVELSTLSATEFAFTSRSPPKDTQAQSNFPFGRMMYVEFDVYTQDNGDMDEFILTSNDGENNNNNFSFNLQVDMNLVSTNPTSPTMVLLEDNVQGYSKHTTFSGKRMDENGEVENLIISITPASNNNDNKNNQGPTLETQQTTTVNDSVDHDTLYNGYTIEGVLIKGHKMYHITTYDNLLKDIYFYQNQQYQVLQDIMASATTAEEENSDKLHHIQSKMDILSQSINNLIQSRLLSDVNDLVIRELPDEGILNCGSTTHHEHDEENAKVGDEEKEKEIEEEEKDNKNVLSIKPSWSLTKWPSTCHPRMNQLSTVFTSTWMLTTNYRLWASAATRESLINNSKVEARTKLMLTLANIITQSQFGVLIQLNEFIHLPSTNTTDYNPAQCGSSGIRTAQSGLNAIRRFNTKHGIFHGLIACIQTNNLAGLNSVGANCKPSGAGFSGVRSIASYKTIIHEIAHGFNAPHPFASTDDQSIGTYGSLMDYTNSGALYQPDIDAGSTGFSYTLHGETKICPYITAALATETPGFLPKSQCWREPETIWTTGCNNDGIVQPWEQCDGNTECCNNCKLKEQATCSIPHSECCVNCQVPNKPTVCTVNGKKKAGICNQRGECIEFESATCKANTNTDCSLNNYLFLNDIATSCRVACPQDTCGGYWSISDLNPYDPCYVTKNDYDTIGMCMPDRSSTSGYTCRPATDNAVMLRKQQYTWNYIVLQKLSCDTQPQLPLIDSYICLDHQGNNVADSYCVGVVKPTRVFPIACDARVLDLTSPSFDIGIDKGSTFIVKWTFIPGEGYTGSSSSPSSGGDAAYGTLVLIYDDKIQKAILHENVLLQQQSTIITIPNHINITATSTASFRMFYGSSLTVSSKIFNIWTYTYHITPWGSCTAHFCGEGVKKRNIYCKRNDNVISNDIKCSGLSLPINTNTELIEKCNPTATFGIDTTCNNQDTGGICINNQCFCSPGWSGPNCATSTCTTTTCLSSKGGICNVNTGQCECTKSNIWFGHLCAGNFNCTHESIIEEEAKITSTTVVITDDSNNIKYNSKCANGGYIVSSATTEETSSTTTEETSSSSSCPTKCTCLNSWTSNPLFLTHTTKQQGCTICNLSCGEYGNGNKDCTTCQCTSSQWSQNCQCRKIELDLTFITYPTIFNNILYSTKTSFDNNIINNNTNINYNEIQQVERYIGLIESTILDILNIHSLRVKIINWNTNNINNKNKNTPSFSFTLQILSKCTTDTTIPQYNTRVNDIKPDDLSDAEELYSFANKIVNIINIYNTQQLDEYGLKYLQQEDTISSISTIPSSQFKQLTTNKILKYTNIINDPLCHKLGDVKKFDCGIGGQSNDAKQQYTLYNIYIFIMTILLFFYISFVTDLL